MSYIRKVIGDNERLVLLTGVHWIYIVEAVFWGCTIAGIGLALDYYIQAFSHFRMVPHDLNLYYFQIDARYTTLPFVFGLMGLAIFSVFFSKYLTTEIGLTDRRIIHKHGLIKIEVQQVELEDIRAEDVHHGWLGWLLGYGRIHFDCRFIDDIYLPATRDPYRLIKAVHTARMRSDQIPTYGVPELETDVARIEQQRIEAFKAREKLKRMALLTKRDFNKEKGKSNT